MAKSPTIGSENTAAASGGRLLECSFVYFFLSLINLRVKLLLTPAWFDGTLVRNHQRLLAFEYTNNEQSRLGQFGIPEMISSLTGCEIESAYIVQRWIFVLTAFVCFHVYLRKWFEERMCFCAVVFLTAIMPLTYYNHLQESAPLLMVTFLLGLWTIRENRWLSFSLVLLVGAVNNETTLILPTVLVFYRWPGWDLTKVVRLAMLTAATALPAYAYTAAIRYVTRHNGHLGDRIPLWLNLRGMLQDAGNLWIDYWRSEHLYLFFFFGALWIFAFLDFRRKPLFLRRASLVIPLFILAHLIGGKISEVRLMIPLAYIVIPMGLMSLFPEGTIRSPRPNEPDIDQTLPESSPGVACDGGRLSP